jgi:hypothetical protein
MLVATVLLQRWRAILQGQGRAIIHGISCADDVRGGGGVIGMMPFACFSARNLALPAAIMMWFPSTCHVAICILNHKDAFTNSMMRHDFMPWPQQ